MIPSSDSAFRASLVVPIYNEAQVIPMLLARVGTMADGVDAAWEFVFINDGSSDDSLAMLVAASLTDERVRVLDLSRNFGHQAAITAGLAAARGDCVVLMDGDLQDPPEVVPEMIAAWREGSEVVVAVRRSRAEQGPRRWAFDAFHRLFGWLADESLATGTGVFGLLDRRALDEILRLPERNRFLPGLRSWVGFKQSTVVYDRQVRAAGEPSQTIGRLLKYGTDAIFSFSYKPLRLSWLLGMTVSTLFFLYGLLLITFRLFGINVVVGFTTPTVAIMFLGGVQLVMVGILGEYMARVYDEVKQRPMYIVRSEYRAGHSLGRPLESGVESLA